MPSLFLLYALVALLMANYNEIDGESSNRVFHKHITIYKIAGGQHSTFQTSK